MLFASFDFLLFFSVAFVGYWLLSARPLGQLVFMTGLSYFFYSASPKPVDGPLPTPWTFVGLLVISTLVDFYSGRAIAAKRGRLIDRSAEQKDKEELRAGGGFLLLSLVFNLGLLGYFKYTDFLFRAASDVASWTGGSLSLPALNLALPLGISFYTFQSLSYTIDVYRGKIEAEASFARFCCFLAFFPQLVAGPIVRAAEFLPQLRSRRAISASQVDAAVFRIAKGLSKKVILGDFIAVYFADIVFESPGEHSSLENLLALYAFTLQIYADFSGYSDVAIGVANLLGFNLQENFDRPYQATDIADFWRRWHMTLSRWLRDYLYYPLGGSRVSSGRGYLNLWVTMFLVGMWHGASWNFVIYSNLQAAAMLYNRFLTRRQQNLASWLQLLFISAMSGVLGIWFMSRVLEVEGATAWGTGIGAVTLAIGVLPRVSSFPSLIPLHVFLTVHFSVFSRLFFRSEDLDRARAMVQKLLEFDALGVREGMFRVQGLSAWLKSHPAWSFLEPISEWGILLVLLSGFVLHYLPTQKLEHSILKRSMRIPGVLVGVAFALLLGLFSLLLSGPRANIYFAF
jgi:alginate O-acetyltransferase complex protein AlgI